MLTNNIFVVLTFACVLVVSACSATVTSPPPSPSILQISSARFFLWEKCEDRWNRERGVTENCCKGNYKCSSDICKSSRTCKFGFLGDWLWCHAEMCTPKKTSKGRNDGDGNSGDKGKDDETQPSNEHDSDDDDDAHKNNDDGKDGKDGASSNGDNSDNETPTPTPTSTQSAIPSRTPMPSPSPSRSGHENLLHCNGRRDRLEIRDMNPEQRRQWRDAITALRADRDENGDSEWDRLVQLHIDFNDEAHDGSYFLPWHRLFLLRLENALRKYQPDLAFPYWDWAQDAADAAMSPVWKEDFAGGAQRGSQPIQSGTFENIDARRPVEHIVRRDFTSGVSGEIPLLWSIGPLDQLTKEEAWSNFTDGMEAAHALPHMYIGGDMSDIFRAPNDPVFYLHHGFVDWLWTERQKITGLNQFGGTHDFEQGTEKASPDRILEAYGVPTRAAFNLECVYYVPPNRPNRNLGGRGARGAPESELDDPCSELPEHSISDDRCRNGLRVLNSESE